MGGWGGGEQEKSPAAGPEQAVISRQKMRNGKEWQKSSGRRFKNEVVKIGLAEIKNEKSLTRQAAVGAAVLMNGKYRTTGIELLLNFIVLPGRCQDFFPAAAEKSAPGSGGGQRLSPENSPPVPKTIHRP
jgi:hypothetical protein